MLYLLDPGMKLKVCVLCSKFSCLFQTSYQKQPCEKEDEHGQNLTTKYKLIITFLCLTIEWRHYGFHCRYDVKSHFTYLIQIDNYILVLDYRMETLWIPL